MSNAIYTIPGIKPRTIRAAAFAVARSCPDNVPMREWAYDECWWMVPSHVHSLGIDAVRAVESAIYSAVWDIERYGA